MKEKDHVSTEQTEQVQEEPRQLIVRFFKNVSTNPKAPVAHYMLDLPAPLKGMVINGTVWADESRGSINYRIDVPGKDRFGGRVLDASPLFVPGQDGNDIPLDSKFARDAHGDAIVTQWQPKLSEAYYRFLKTGASLQAVTF